MKFKNKRLKKQLYPAHKLKGKNMKQFKLLLFLILAIVVRSAAAQVGSLAIDEKLPTDSKITIGKLDNGITYYIRENKKPENRAELRLAVNAGAILEDDDQRGLAHFVEHMAFNGTKNFAKQEIVNFLESIGMRFGADINAYTGFDETVYMLQVPTDSAAIVEKGFQILEEWAHNVSFDKKEVDKERGVVVEEWRIGRGADARMRDKQFPILFKNSRYAERLPIGKKETLENASVETIQRFYKDWYRPDLMAIVAVGDFDKTWIEKLIQERFSGIKNRSDVRKREMYEVPNHSETLFTTASDLEATNTNISVYRKMEVAAQGTARAYRQSLVENLYNAMLNSRLQELLQQSEPPYLGAFSGKGRFVRSKEFYVLGAVVKEDGISTGLETILTEAERVKQFGFTQSELEREKVEMLRGMEQAYNERDKTRSRNYASEFIRNFLTDESLPGIEYEFMLYNKFIPEITLDEVSQLSNEWLREDSRVVTLSAPEKEGIALPAEKALRAVIEAVAQKEVTAYKDNVPDMPLVENPPVPGSVTSEKSITEIGVTEWQLANGVRVVLKPTDFKNDQILFTAFSLGGHSLVTDKNYIPGRWASSIVRLSGLGRFNQIALQKKLAGKLVSVSPYIDELEEGIAGNAAPQDIETAMQLIYLYFTAPRKDQTAFESLRERILGFIQNRGASPEAAYQDTIQVTMTNYHHRSRPLSEAVVNELDLDESFRIYQERFADAGDFTFFFVGNFKLDEMKPLVEKYIGGLHTIGRTETWKDIGEKAPVGIIHKQVKKGLEPKSRVSIVFTGAFDWSRKNRYHFSSMAAALRIKLREILREDLGGTYGVRVSAASSRFPKSNYSINVGFACAPERVDELTQTVFQQLDSLKTVGTTEKYLNKVKETQLRTRETDLQENQFWLNTLEALYYHESDPKNIFDYENLVKSLSLDDVQQAAKKYFDLNNYVQVVLYPDESKSQK